MARLLVEAVAVTWAPKGFCELNGGAADAA
jgi:hypothetical protein